MAKRLSNNLGLNINHNGFGLSGKHPPFPSFLPVRKASFNYPKLIKKPGTFITR